MRYESFVKQESFKPATNFTELRKRLQNFHESTAQRNNGQSGSVALAVKRDLKKRPKKGNCFVCEIPGHFAKDYRKKETAQCSKCGEKGHLDRACKRQIDGGKQESVAVGPTGSNVFTRRGILGSSYPVEDSRNASGQWLYRSHSDEHRCVPVFCAQ